MPIERDHTALGRWILKNVFKIDIDNLVSKRSASIAMRNAVEKQKNQLDEIVTNLTHQLKESRRELASVKKGLTQLEKDHNKLKSIHDLKLSEIYLLEAEKRSMQSQMSDFEIQIKELKKTVKLREAKLTEAISVQESLRADSTGKAELENKIAKCEELIASLTDDVKSRNLKIEGLEAQAEVYKNRLNDVINDKEQCEKEYISRINGLQDQIARLQSLTAPSDGNEEDLSKEIKELSQALAGYESALQEKSETIEAQKAEIKRLQAKLDASANRHEEIVKELQRLLRDKDCVISQQADTIKNLEEALSGYQQKEQDHPVVEEHVSKQALQVPPTRFKKSYYPLATDFPVTDKDATPHDMPTIFEDGSVETTRSIESVINCETGEHINANAFFDRPKEEIAMMSRKLEIIAKSGDAPLFVCEKCRQPVRISKITHSKGETLFFAHCHREEPCEWRTKNESVSKPVIILDESEISAAEVEKSRYEQLRELIYNTLRAQQRKGFEINEVEIDKKIKGETSRLYRTFDVYVKWRSIDIVFKLQRSTDYLQDLVCLDEFCKQKKIFIIWVFGSDSATNYNYLLKNNYQNTLFDNRSCVFILDHEAERACTDNKELTLKCNWLIDGKHWYHTLARTQSNGVLVTLKDLSFDNTETYKPYYQQMIITRSIGNESIELKHGVYKYCENSLWGIYNKIKEIKAECKYSEIYLDDNANIVAVTADYLDKRKGYLSDEGVEIPSERKWLATDIYLLTIFERFCLADKDDVPFTSMYKLIEEWCNDRLKIMSDDGYGIMDYHGQIIAKPEYKEFKIINSHTALVTDYSGTYKINYLNEIIPDETIDLPDGFRKVRHLDKWGIYNPEGRLIINYLYNEITSFRKRFIGINENEVVKLNNAPRYDYRLSFRATYKGLWKNGYIFDCHGVEMKMLKSKKNSIEMIVGKEYSVYLTNAQLKGTQSVCAIAVADNNTNSSRFDHIDLDSDFSMGERLVGTITKKKAPNRLYISFNDGRQTYISRSRITQSGLNPSDYSVGASIELEKIDFDPYYETTKWKVIK